MASARSLPKNPKAAIAISSSPVSASLELAYACVRSCLRPPVSGCSLPLGGWEASIYAGCYSAPVSSSFLTKRNQAEPKSQTTPTLLHVDPGKPKASSQLINNQTSFTLHLSPAANSLVTSPLPWVPSNASPDSPGVERRSLNHGPATGPAWLVWTWQIRASDPAQASIQAVSGLVEVGTAGSDPLTQFPPLHLPPPSGLLPASQLPLAHLRSPGLLTLAITGEKTHPTYPPPQPTLLLQPLSLLACFACFALLALMLGGLA